MDRVPSSGALRFGRVLLLLVVVGLMASCAFTTVSTGHVGVTSIFGAVTGETLYEGFHVINPLKRVTELSIRTQEIKELAEVPSSEGLVMHLETSILYRLDDRRAPDVLQKIGPDYAQVVLVPNFRSVMRAITASHTANALYSEARDLIAQQMLEHMKKSVESRGILIENVLLRDIKLPQTLQEAIEAKQQADQEAQRMNFVLQKEKQEAERKRIEAQGIADFQRIVSQGISPALLEWKGIEATVEVAKSQNAKVIVVGSQKNGLPLIIPGQ